MSNTLDFINEEIVRFEENDEDKIKLVELKAEKIRLIIKMENYKKSHDIPF
jgi:hypothetical protein